MTYLNWITDHWPTILALLGLVPTLTTLIVGGTNAPTKSDKPKDLGEKISDWMKLVAQVFAIVNHRDQEGTLKAPFVARRKDVRAEEASTTAPSPPSPPPAT